MRIAGSMAAVLILQLLAGLVVVAFCLGISGLGLESKSALVGVFIGVIPNAMYAWRVSRTTKRDPQKVLRSHYIAEAVKLVTTFLLFALAFSRLEPLNAVVLFVAFVAVIAANWAALLLVR